MFRSCFAVTIVFFTFSQTCWADDAHVFVIVKNGDEVAIEKVTVKTGMTEIILCGEDSKYIDVVFPPSAGGSASLAQKNTQRLLTVRNKAGQIEISEQANGQRRDLPAIADPDQYETRVCITDSDGNGNAFVVSRYREVHVDKAGPVIDLFAGKVPVKEGDFIICLDTYSVRKKASVSGTILLELDRYFFVRVPRHDGKVFDFILDTGGAQTVVGKSFLPENATIQKSQMVQYSSAGKKMLKYSPAGATGTVANVLGHTLLAGFQMGELNFGDVEVAVMDEIPDLFGRPVAGIIGIDMLKRNGFAKFSLGAEDKQSKLLLSNRSTIETTDSVPFSIVKNHLMIPIKIADKEISVILDTGAPYLLLDEVAAKATGIKAVGQPKNARGIDKGKSIVHDCIVENLNIGKTALQKVEAKFGALAVFAPLNVHGQLVGLLGNRQVSHFAEMEIDFESRVIRFKR